MPTIKDVAKETGLSVGTVSRVLITEDISVKRHDKMSIGL